MHRKRYIKSGDNDTSASAFMWHQDKEGNTLSSLAHLASVLVATFSSSCSVQYYTPFSKNPPVILSILGFVQLNISINYLHEKWMFHLIKSTDDRKLGGMANTADNRIKI